MDKRQLEQKSRDLIERTLKGLPVEDSTIELKTTWLRNEDAARQLAGHANAARGEPILWLVGIDEKQRMIVGVEQEELANWFPAVSANFDQKVCPALLLNVNVHIDGKVIVGLYFDTELAPYLVKNPLFGKPNGGAIQYEVPWRQGNSTRSATRADLLRILLKASKRPSIEIRKAVMTFSHHLNNQEKWHLEADLYVVPKDSSPIVFPAHQWSGGFLHVYTSQWLGLEIRPINIRESSSGVATSDQIRCVGPMGFTMMGERVITSSTRSFPDEIDATLRLGIAGSEDTHIDVHLKMTNMTQRENGTITWEQGDWKRPQIRIGAL